MILLLSLINFFLIKTLVNYVSSVSYKMITKFSLDPPFANITSTISRYRFLSSGLTLKELSSSFLISPSDLYFACLLGFKIYHPDMLIAKTVNRNFACILPT